MRLGLSDSSSFFSGELEQPEAEIVVVVPAAGTAEGAVDVECGSVVEALIVEEVRFG